MASTTGDDGALIDEADTTPSQGGRSGGDLATDVATEGDMARVDDPDHRARVTKQDEIDHDAEVRPDRPRAANAGAEPPSEPNHTVG